MPLNPNKPTVTNTSKRNRKPKSTRKLNGNTHVGILTFFPPRGKCTLPYVDEFSISTPGIVSTFGTQTSYRLNSLFDPYFSAGGHQPYGYDQMCTFYNRYMVDRVDIEVTFSDPTVDGLVVGAFAFNYNDTYQLQNSTISQADERPTLWTKNLNDSGSQVAIYKKSIVLHQLMGLTKQQYEGGWDSLSALITADPAITPYFSIAVADARGNTASQSVRVKVRLLYYATFWERRTVAQS